MYTLNRLRRDLPAFAITGVTLAMSLSACASESRAGTQPTTTSARADLGDPNAAHGRLCPVQIPGTTVTASDIEGGAALDFRNNADRVVAIRQDVRDIAAVYNHHATGEPIDGAPPPPAQISKAGSIHPDLGMPVGSASVEEIDGGARLVLRPDNPSQLQALRDRAKLNTGRVVGDDCDHSQPSGS
jgi:hypothetical protein